MDGFTVTLDGTCHRFFRGAIVRDLIGRLDPADQEAIASGRACVTDARGDRLGLEGSLEPGERYLLARAL